MTTDSLSTSAATTSQAPAKHARLTHVNSSGEAHMVDVGHKDATSRVAIAAGTVFFSNDQPLKLIGENNNKKGDVISTARVAGIMAAKRTSDIIPLCHPIPISKVAVELTIQTPSEDSEGRNRHGSLRVQAAVKCTGPTGVEMEALTAVMGTCLTVYDMCKAVDKAMTIEDTRLLYKAGGVSGDYIHESFRDECEQRLTEMGKVF